MAAILPWHLVVMSGIFVIFTASHGENSINSEITSLTGCKGDRLTVYKVIFKTFWSREKFPKHYPDWRPLAQWSKLIGRSHNKSYTLWRLGSLASEGVKIFTETGKTDVLDAEAQGNGGVYDEFMAAPISIGVGQTQAEFFVDGNHSKVSLMCHLHPSPDWFVGIDSFDLCVQGKWLDAVTLEVDPMDAGTDEGYTFTAPNWKSEPQEKIYRLTAQYPNNSANSFYYPRRHKLPYIATFTLLKEKEYELSEIFYHEDTAKLSPQKYEYVEEETNLVHRGKIEPPPKFALRPNVHNKPHYKSKYPINDPKKNHQNSPIPATFNSPQKNTTKTTTTQHRRPKLRRGPRNCRVTEWSEWSECSRTCGIGQMRRTRIVVKHARRGGRPCPNLVIQKWCGSAKCVGVPTRYFE
uniref:Spondin domain-containing protein n=1 Tax=Strigamia maritima TaxID=126957 RepID=T1JDJ4_STRMM